MYIILYMIYVIEKKFCGIFRNFISSLLKTSKPLEIGVKERGRRIRKKEKREKRERERERERILLLSV